MMVDETTCGLSFQLTKGGIDDQIEIEIMLMVFRLKISKKTQFPKGESKIFIEQEIKMLIERKCGHFSLGWSLDLEKDR